MPTKTYTPAELDHELARRQHWPPDLRDWQREELVTVEMLRAELRATPLNHEDHEWREWELALAERQAVLAPGQLFYRIVEDVIH